MQLNEFGKVLGLCEILGIITLGDLKWFIKNELHDDEHLTAGLERYTAEVCRASN